MELKGNIYVKISIFIYVRVCVCVAPGLKTHPYFTAMHRFPLSITWINTGTPWPVGKYAARLH